MVFADIDAGPPAPPVPGEHDTLSTTLADERMALVLCSLRTRVQLESLRKVLGLGDPFICENGAAAFAPPDYFGSDLDHARSVAGNRAIEFGRRYEYVVRSLGRTAERMRTAIVGFSDMSVEQVASERGLSLLDAQLAKLREYNEVFRLTQSNPLAEKRLVRALESTGLCCTSHNGFVHVGSSPGPSAAVAVLATLFRISRGVALSMVVAPAARREDIARRVDVSLDPPPLAPSADGSGWAPWLDQLIARVRRARHEHPLSRSLMPMSY
jgi:predicted mannosyl-3-phosphoglycerate phosphatase (HAD superfamily)